MKWFSGTLIVIGSALIGLNDHGAVAYPGGTPDFQTDVAPFCAGCHASTADSDLAGLGDRASAELAIHKHLEPIRRG